MGVANPVSLSRISKGFRDPDEDETKLARFVYVSPPRWSTYHASGPTIGPGEITTVVSLYLASQIKQVLCQPITIHTFAVITDSYAFFHPPKHAQNDFIFGIISFLKFHFREDMTNLLADYWNGGFRVNRKEHYWGLTVVAQEELQIMDLFLRSELRLVQSETLDDIP